MEEVLIPQIKVENGPDQDLPVSPAVEEPVSPPTTSVKFKTAKKFPRPILIALVILGALTIYFGLSGFLVYKRAIFFKNAALNVVSAVKAKDLTKTKLEIDKTERALKSLKSTFRLVSWTKIFPFVGSYVADTDRVLKAGVYGLETGDILLTTIEPYADLLGFNVASKEAKDGAKTASDRIDFLVKTIPDLAPKIDEISGKAALIQKEVKDINPDRYPVKFMGKEVRSRVKSFLSLINTGTGFIANGKPLIESAPYLLGIDGKRTYLVLFQNDKELRPTGGFLTAYSVMTVEKGKFNPVVSSDIYNLDNKYKPTVLAPDPIVKYLKGPYVLSPNLRLRDMNWSPDFAKSMELFTSEISKTGISKVDGVIAVDTQVLVYLLDAIGKIGVPGFGNFSTEIEAKCNCPNVIYELESFADIEGPVVWDPAGTGKIIYAPANYDNRKKIIGPLMNSILANAMGQPKEKIPQLFEAGFKALNEKHVLFFIFDEKVQKAVSDFGIGGVLKETGGDYLFINDANLGGRKSNLYVTQEVNVEYRKVKNYIEKVVTITYKNSEKQDGWLNSVLPNWVRIYVPKGSTLISFEGLEEKVEPYEDLEKTVFAGFFKLRPQGVSKITATYRLPFKVEGDLDVYLQKQPGTDAPLYQISGGKDNDEFYLKTDKSFKLRL